MLTSESEVQTIQSSDHVFCCSWELIQSLFELDWAKFDAASCMHLGSVLNTTPKTAGWLKIEISASVNVLENDSNLMHGGGFKTHRDKLPLCNMIDQSDRLRTDCVRPIQSGNPPRGKRRCGACLRTADLSAFHVWQLIKSSATLLRGFASAI